MGILNVRLNSRETEQMQSLCEETGLTKTELVKQSIKLFSESKGSRAYELGKGLFGADRSPEKNVAANCKRLLKAKLREKHYR